MPDEALTLFTVFDACR